MSIAEKLTTIAENEQRVFESGVEKGKTAEWNKIYDGLQAMGGRSNYSYFFSYSNFIVDKDTTPRWNFKPKYDIKPKNAREMFRSFNSGSSGGVNYENIKIDLAQWLEDFDVELNMSNCTDAQSMFYNCQGLTRVPFIDLSKCTGSNTLANFCGQSAVLTTIDGIKSSENTAWVSTSFNSSNPLEHCIFSGVIGKNFYANNLTKLNHDSLVSIIKTLSETTSNLTATLSLTAVNNAFGSTESSEWLSLVAEKPNWTISLK